MKKIIRCGEKEFKQIKNDKQLYKIFDSDLILEYLENCTLINNATNETLEIQITSVKKYSNIKDALKIISLDKFGVYDTEEEFIQYVNKSYNVDDGYIVCRVKKLESKVKINDKVLLEKIKLETLEQEKLGLSGCLVYRVKTKNNDDAILKIQNIKGSDTLKEEYEVLKYLKGKMNVANVYYYNIYDGKEYLLREYIEGKPLYQYKKFGYELGIELKKIHQNYSKSCKFNKFSTQNLLSNALDKIDVVYQLRSEYFKDYSKNDLIRFLRKNKPNDDSLIHGDFSLTNILVNKHKYYYIDLGNVSISTKYFDIYVLNKSLKINHLESEYEKFLKGYNIKDYNEKYFYWMELIEISYN